MKRIIFITENVNKFKELHSYLQNYCSVMEESCKVSLEMIKSETEINEIQSLNKEEIVMYKLYEAFTRCQQLFTVNQKTEDEIWILVEESTQMLYSFHLKLQKAENLYLQFLEFHRFYFLLVLTNQYLMNLLHSMAYLDQAHKALAYFDR